MQDSEKKLQRITNSMVDFFCLSSIIYSLPLTLTSNLLDNFEKMVIEKCRT
jgi:hypothetical protein